MTQQPDSPGPDGNPERDPLYRSILGVLVASVLVGAVLTLAGDTLFGSRALASVGLGMAVIAGAAYWVIRLATRKRAGGKRDAD
jgi:predicted lipid-binding transport protein (Tim44 family)